MYDESKHTQVSGTAVAQSGGAGSTSAIQWLPEGTNATFTKVPKGRKLVLTDIILEPQGSVTADHTVNLAEKSAGGTRIFYQFNVGPGPTGQSHFHTGQVIVSGREVVAFTGAGTKAGQYISIFANAYLAKA